MDERKSKIETLILDILVAMECRQYTLAERAVYWKRLDQLLRLYIEIRENERKDGTK